MEKGALDNLHSCRSTRIAAGLLTFALSMGVVPLRAEAHQISSDAPTGNDIRQYQQFLNDDLVPLGFPALTVDGRIGKFTQRAICAGRFLTNKKPTRQHNALTKQDIAAQGTDTVVSPVIPEITRRVRSGQISSGIIINETCQIGVVTNNNTVTSVFPVSTGKQGKGTPNEVNNIDYGRFGWHNSTLYPDESGNGNMYKPLYWRPKIALHGYRTMNDNVTTPNSNGCARVSVEDADMLWKVAAGPEQARQDQYISRVNHLPVAVIGAFEYDVK